MWLVQVREDLIVQMNLKADVTGLAEMGGLILRR